MIGEFSFGLIYSSHHAMPASICLLSLLTMLTTVTSQQHDEHLIIRTIEKLPVHTEVINLRRLLFPKNLSDNFNVDFSLAKRDEFPYMFFLINHSSRGQLTIRKEIDRDELCRLRRCRCDTWCDLELEIFINSEQFNIELITIRILDRNDHKPVFANQNNPLNLTIVENAPVGAMIKLEAAIDHDQGANGIVGYSLVSSRSLPFSLRYDLLRGGLSLMIDQALDRERQSSYQFDIIARDGENQTGILRVYVTVDDINDSPPKFEQSVYTMKNVSENLPINSIVGRVHATDQDEGVNGEISYYLISQEQAFQVDRWTGDLRVIDVLDYETKNRHRLEIEARDGGEGSKTDFCTVLIDLLDENDNAPIIDTYPYEMLPELNTVKILLNESLSINSLVLSLSIIDRDSGDNGRVTWKLNQSSIASPFELIRLTENTGELRTKYRLDREHLSEYRLTLDATDHGRPIPKSTRLNLLIIVLDENDNAPRFAQTMINATISEHVKISRSDGYEVFHLRADDADQGLNREISFSIIKQEKNLFQIDSKTGIIRAMVEFDRQQQETYIVHVEARDQGTPSLSSHATITFTVVSRNEHSPVCNTTNPRMTWSIIENSLRGTVLGTILCRDDDQNEPNGQMSVHVNWFAEEDDDRRNRTRPIIPFEIRTLTNRTSETSVFMIVISVNGSIDREMLPFYSLLLTVSDHGNPSRSVNLSLSIEVLDENDHCPQLHLDSSFLMLNRDLLPAPYLTHLRATDLDQALNGQVSFELSPSIAPSFIHLYANGTLLVQTDSDRIEENALIVLHVQIRDHGEPTPCLIVETLRLFFGSNRTDWRAVAKNNHQYDTAIRLSTEASQQGKRMAHAYSIPSSSISSPLFQYSSLLSLLSTRKQLFAVFIGSSILMFIILSTTVLCFVDCQTKKSKQTRLEQKKKTKKNISMVSLNGLNQPCSTSLSNGKPLSISSPMSRENFYDNHQYKNLIPPTPVTPVVVLASSNSHSLSSIDSTTRANTAHNRTLTTNTYTYTALSTSDDFIPGEFDDQFQQMMDQNGVEYMMTTV